MKLQTRGHLIGPICASGLLALLSPVATFSQGESPRSGPPEIKLTVAAVQLYSHQALVHRGGTVKLQPGTNEFTIADLSEHLIDESVKLSAGGSPGIKIQEIRLETRHEKIFRHEKAREAETFLKEASAKLKRATDEYAALKAEEKLLKEIQIGKVTDEKQLAKRFVDPARWKETLDFVQNSLARNHNEMLSVLDRTDEAREELNVALTVAERYRSGQSVQKKEVLVTVESDAARAVPLRLEYRIRGAGWFPIYAARASTRQNSGDLSLFAYALVKNETGENWPDVPLSFSAADPEETAALPNLSEWRIRAVLRERQAATEQAAGEARSDDNFRGMPADQERALAPAPALEAPMRALKMYEKNKDSSGPLTGSLSKNSPGGGLAAGKPLPLQRLEAESAQSQAFYSTNRALVKEKRASKKSDQIQRDLDGLKDSVTNQQRALDGGNYNEALNQSVRTIQNIRNMDPRYQGYFLEDARKAEEVRRKSLAMLETEKLIAQLVAPVISSGGYDYRYVAALRETIPSDGAFHKVLLFEKKLPVELGYESVPSANLLAFLVGKVTYRDDSPLLTGPVSVFHNLDYVGQARLDNVSARRSFDLHLGSDEDVKISRRTSEFRSTKGLLSNDYELEQSVRITVQNRKKFPVTLNLLDRIPYSENELVSVTDVQFNPAPTKKNDEGLVRFHLELKPGEKREIEISYRLRHPKDSLPVYRQQGSPRW